MKSDDIIKALECCKDRRCEGCVREINHYVDESICRLDLIEHALHLINCQKKEIETQAVNMEALETGTKREKERADRQSRWIPVTERLPEICENVIVYVVYHSSRYVNVIRSVVPAYYTEDGFWMYGRGIRLQNVTHWMPLPDAPEEGGGKQR